MKVWTCSLSEECMAKQSLFNSLLQATEIPILAETGVNTFNDCFNHFVNSGFGDVFNVNFCGLSTMAAIACKRIFSQ